MKIIKSFSRNSLHLQMAGDMDPGIILQQAFSRGPGGDFNVLMANECKPVARESAVDHLAHMGRVGLELVRATKQFSPFLFNCYCVTVMRSNSNACGVMCRTDATLEATAQE